MPQQTAPHLPAGQALVDDVVQGQDRDLAVVMRVCVVSAVCVLTVFHKVRIATWQCFILRVFCVCMCRGGIPLQAPQARHCCPAAGCCFAALLAGRSSRAATASVCLLVAPQRVHLCDSGSPAHLDLQGLDAAALVVINLVEHALAHERPQVVEDAHLGWGAGVGQPGGFRRLRRLARRGEAAPPAGGTGPCAARRAAVLQGRPPRATAALIGR